MTDGLAQAAVAAGDRAPDGVVPGRPERLFDLFRGPHFTLLGPPVAARPDAVRCVDVRPYGDGAQILVRPDGYVALVADASNAEAMPAYARKLDLRLLK